MIRTLFENTLGISVRISKTSTIYLIFLHKKKPPGFFPRKLCRWFWQPGSPIGNQTEILSLFYRRLHLFLIKCYLNSGSTNNCFRNSVILNLLHMNQVIPAGFCQRFASIIVPDVTLDILPAILSDNPWGILHVDSGAATKVTPESHPGTPTTLSGSAPGLQPSEFI